MVYVSEAVERYQKVVFITVSCTIDYNLYKTTKSRIEKIDIKQKRKKKKIWKNEEKEEGKEREDKNDNKRKKK